MRPGSDSHSLIVYLKQLVGSSNTIPLARARHRLLQDFTVGGGRVQCKLVNPHTKPDLQAFMLHNFYRYGQIYPSINYLVMDVADCGVGLPRLPGCWG